MASAARALAALRSDVVFINGAWKKTLSTFPVTSPLTGLVHAQAPQGTVELVDEAVKAAAAAFSSWGVLPAAARAAHLRSLADELEKRRDDVASVEAFNCGKPVREAYGDVDDACTAFRYCARQAENINTYYPQPVEPMPDTAMRGSVTYEPVGVVAAICPFNFPLMMCAWKVGPSLAAGCTIVIKPSEFTPFSALCLADAAIAAGIPHGVINVVTGAGDVGSALTTHPLVNKVTFTGSVPTGVKVMTAAAPDIKRVTLELGGKSPAIVFGDCDVDKAIEWLFFGFAWNAGMICSATARLIVHESIVDMVVAKLVAASGRVKAAGPFDDGAELGPINNAAQYKKVMGYIAQAHKEGLTLACGGGPPNGLEAQYAGGYFIAPTIFTGVTPKHTIFQEEVFGPVATVTTFSTEAEAIALANDSEFGLAAAIFTTDAAKGERVASAVRAGTVWINQAQPSPHALTWGGFKKSGIGREMGPLALLPFL